MTSVPTTGSTRSGRIVASSPSCDLDASPQVPVRRAVPPAPRPLEQARVWHGLLAAVRDGTVTATARPLHVGSRTIVVETEVRRADGRLVAKTTQTQIVLR